jgi:hypothetical protein
MSIPKDKLINNRIQWYGHVLRMSKYTLLVLNMKLKDKWPQDQQQVRKDVIQKEGRTWEETECWENRHRWRGLTARRTT